MTLSVLEQAAPKSAWNWDRIATGILLGFLGLYAASFIVFGDIDADEVEHVHISWLLHQGTLPYRDIHQIHTPLLWLFTAPLFSVLPEQPLSIILLRGLCGIALVLSLIITMNLHRAIRPRAELTERLLPTVIILAVAGMTQFWRFRPDPFMTLCVSGALSLIILPSRKPLLKVFLVGCLLGLAVTFSPKSLPILFFYPVLRIWKGRESLFRAFIGYGAGLLTGFLPVAAWLYFRGLGPDFFHWVIKNNAQMTNLTTGLFHKGGLSGMLLLGISLSGVVGAKLSKERTGPASGPLGMLIFSVPFFWAVQLIDPNHLAYNLQPLAVPAAVLGSIGISSIRRQVRPAFRPLPMLIVVALTIHLSQSQTGLKIPFATMKALLAEAGPRHAACVGFAPFHPVFRRNASALYLSWDSLFLHSQWVRPRGQQPYRDMWADAPTRIIAHRPALIILPGLFSGAVREGWISPEDYAELQAVWQKDYDMTIIGGIQCLVRKEQ